MFIFHKIFLFWEEKLHMIGLQPMAAVYLEVFLLTPILVGFTALHRKILVHLLLLLRLKMRLPRNCQQLNKSK